MQYRSVVLSAVLLSATLAGCSSNLFTDDNKIQPMKFFERRDWAATGAPAEADFNSGPVTPEDLVDANGGCAAIAVASAPPPAPPAGAIPASEAGAQGIPAAPPVLGGIALGMTECQVVQRAGQPGNIQISADAGNERATVLTYMSGNWPGIYRFGGGRLREVERVAMPEPPKPVKPVKKKKAAPKTAAR